MKPGLLQTWASVVRDRAGAELDAGRPACHKPCQCRTQASSTKLRRLVTGIPLHGAINNSAPRSRADRGVASACRGFAAYWWLALHGCAMQIKLAKLPDMDYNCHVAVLQEKRKRDAGQAKSAKNYVEEEKRLARNAGVYHGFDS